MDLSTEPAALLPRSINLPQTFESTITDRSCLPSVFLPINNSSVKSCVLPTDTKESCGSMAVNLLLLFWWATQLFTAQGNFYFATHDSYLSSTYLGRGFSVTNIAGDVATVTQQCRRACVLQPKCNAYNMTLLSGDLSLGVFCCRFFNYNACKGQQMSVASTTSSPFVTLWERLDAVEFKPKPCVEYCGVKFQGNCTACRGFEGLTGFDCDVAPRLCSDYGITYPGWPRRLIWPWGFYGRKILAMCHNKETVFLYSNAASNGSQVLFSMGWADQIRANDMTSFIALQLQIDWELIAELQALSEFKIFTVHRTFGGVRLDYRYSGFKLSAYGELSLEAYMNTTASMGFPTPLYKAPFMSSPNGSKTCGSFWQFAPDVSVCQQQTNLLNFTDIHWNGTTFTAPCYLAMSFL